MKSKVQSISLFLILLIVVQLTFCNKAFLKAKQDYESIWQTMFSGSRGQLCQDPLKNRLNLNKKKVLNNVSEPLKNVKAQPANFEWVKNWGFGPSAYMFDFLDPVLKPDILKEFHKIFNSIKAMPSEDPEYKDPFDLKKLTTNINDKELKAKAVKDLSKLNKTLNPKVHESSVNAVQLRKALKEWKWGVDLNQEDYARTFIQKYDINGDGRLNPRELILGAIDQNKHLLGTAICMNCFFDVIKKIDAIFMYIDCNSDGFISSEDLWNNLPKLKRNTPKYNMFALSKQGYIRTSSVNDFILSNMNTQNGLLNKNEFRIGILFGFWNRQTNHAKVIDGDERTLEELRWTDDDMVDFKLEDYLKELKKREEEADANDNQ